MNGECCTHGREEESAQVYLENEKKSLVRYSRNGRIIFNGSREIK